MPSGRRWICYLASPSLSEWYPEDYHWHFGDFGFVVNATDEPTLTYNRNMWFQYHARIQGWVAAHPGAHPVLYIPPGETYAFNDVLNSLSDSSWKIYGRLLAAGSNDPTGGALLVVSYGNNVHIDGGGVGIIESVIGHGDDEGVTGDVNCVAIGNSEDAFMEPLYGIRLSNITIKGARHWSPSVPQGEEEPEGGESEFLGHGGGKGLTLQHGVVGFQASGVVCIDCDIGVSVEGIHGAPACLNPNDPDPECVPNPNSKWKLGCQYTHGVDIDAAFVDCRYMAVMAGASLNEDTLDVNIRATAVNCGSGYAVNDDGFDPDEPGGPDPEFLCASKFGVFTFCGARNVKLDARVFNAEGVTTLVRGNMTGCDLDISAHVEQLLDAVYFAPHAGYQSHANLLPERNNIRMKVQIDDDSGMQYLVRGHGFRETETSPIIFPRASDFDLTWSARVLPSTWVQTWTGPAQFDMATLGANNTYIVRNQGGTTTLVPPAHSCLQIGDAVNNNSTSATGLVHAVPASTAVTLQRHRQGGTDVSRWQLSTGGTLQFAGLSGAPGPSLALTSHGSVTVGQATQDVTMAGRTVKMPPYSDGTRPSAATVGANSWIWKTSDNAPNYSDGTNWCLMDGTVT